MIKPTGEVHPVADLFPMMTDDELDDLAADIQANGLLHPIVLDENGVLIDGRNRLAGCQRAGVEPTFSALNGHDPIALIISSNVTRRHLNKGQQAMAIARASRLSTKFTTRSAVAGVSVSHQRVHQAMVVLEFAPDLADAVLSGHMPMNSAYEEARERKESAMSDEARFERLRSESSELASKVQEGELTLAGALAEMTERKRQQEEAAKLERQRVELVTKQFARALRTIDPEDRDPNEWARDWMNADPDLLDGYEDFSAERALRAAEALRLYAQLKQEKENV